MSVETPQIPRQLHIAAWISAGQGLILLVLAVAQLVTLSPERMTMGTTTAVFFAVFGLLILAAARGLQHGQPWARGPILLTQLIALGLAWSFRGTWAVVLVLVLAAGAVLASVAHPASIRALADEPDGR